MAEVAGKRQRGAELRSRQFKSHAFVDTQHQQAFGPARFRQMIEATRAGIRPKRSAAQASARQKRQVNRKFDPTSCFPPLVSYNAEMYASEIKISLVSWIIPQLGVDDVLGSEVPFLDQARKADLVIVRPDNLVAIEIKGPRDDLRRLAAQVSHYQSMFLETYVAVHERDIPVLKKRLPRGVGIISVANGRPPSISKQAAHKNYLEKSASLNWLNASHLRLVKQETLQAKRQQLMQSASKKDLSTLAISAANAKIIHRYNIFLDELGKNVSNDDITTLSTPHKIRL